MMTLDHSMQTFAARLRRFQNRRYFRLITWFAAGIPLIVILCSGLLITLVNSESGHRYLLGLAQRKASSALGASVQLENFALHLPTLSLDLYGVRIAGAAPHTDPPLLQADHLKVGVRVVSVLSRTWYLDQIQIDHPVAWVVVDKNGVSNLPVFKSSGTSHTDLFDLGIRHVQIVRGEVYYNSRPYALTADLHDLAFNSTFSSLSKRYSGNLAYSNANLTFGSLRPLQHNLESEFDATPTTFTLKRGTVTAGPSRATVSATIENYGNPAVKAQYQVVLDGKQAAKILDEPTLPAGSVQTSGSLQFQQSPDRSTIQSLVISGTLASDSLALNTVGGSHQRGEHFGELFSRPGERITHKSSRPHSGWSTGGRRNDAVDRRRLPLDLAPQTAQSLTCPSGGGLRRALIRDERLAERHSGHNGHSRMGKDDRRPDCTRRRSIGRTGSESAVKSARKQARIR